MSRAIWVLVLVIVGGLVPRPANGAATLIPDHTFRLGSCGGPNGSACSWECGAGKGCSGGGQCALEGASAFGAVLVAKLDDVPCGGVSGSVFTTSWAGEIGGEPFALADTAFDLCGRDIACSGRQPRGCNACGDGDPSHLLCTSDDGQGGFPCPPGNTVFFCEDPCAGSDGFLTEDDANLVAAWFSETRQPLPEVVRAALPGAPPLGRPVVYHAQSQLFPAGDPPVTRICARIFYTSQERPLGVCAGAVDRMCATDGDCENGGPCLDGTPAGVNPPAPDAVVANSVCSGGPRAGKPCAGAADCGGASCQALSASASARFCSGSLAACADDASCPGGESCVSCPQPACGDGVVDPGEACDDGNGGAGDGCDAACDVEPCFECDRVLGEQSFCVASSVGAPCDADGTACTLGQCGGFGQCIDGAAPTGCADAAATKAKLALKRDPVNPAKAKLSWKWTSAAAFDVSGLGNPAASDDVTLCVFDQGGLRFDVRAPAGGICGTKPCWSAKPGSVQYRSKVATPDGVTKLAAKSGEAGRGKLQTTAKGANLVFPLPLAAPVRTVAVREDGSACWEAVFPVPTVADDLSFKAKN